MFSVCTEEHSFTSDLLNAAIHPVDLLPAYRRVGSKVGSGVVDGMSFKELNVWIRKNDQTIREEVLTEQYEAQSFRKVFITKSGGGKRKLGFPTALDRLL